MTAEDAAGLAAFLEARLDDEEANARAAGPARIAWLTYLRDDGLISCITTVAAGDDVSPWCADGKELPEPAEVRVVYDPARVIAGIAARRALTAEYRRTRDKAPGNLPLLNTLHRLMQSAAAVHSDHPGYRAAWKPA